MYVYERWICCGNTYLQPETYVSIRYMYVHLYLAIRGQKRQTKIFANKIIILLPLHFIVLLVVRWPFNLFKFEIHFALCLCHG